MITVFRLSSKFLIGLCLVVAGFFAFQSVVPELVVHAQSAVDSIKARIKTVVSNVDGKISLQTKNRLITLIGDRVRTSSNATVADIYAYFLREVKKLRTVDQIVAINAGNTNTSNTNQTSSTTAGGPDFLITFASIAGSVQLDQKFATVTVKIKNMGATYSSDGLGSLKFGCKGVDGTIYPYRSYLESAPPITTNNEVVFEVPNVFIGNLTSNKGFKLLVCKIDSADLIQESNEINNTVNVSLQVN